MHCVSASVRDDSAVVTQLCYPSQRMCELRCAIVVTNTNNTARVVLILLLASCCTMLMEQDCSEHSTLACMLDGQRANQCCLQRCCCVLEHECYCGSCLHKACVSSFRSDRGCLTTQLQHYQQQAFKSQECGTMTSYMHRSAAILLQHIREH
jgi:hypothetical protein